MKHPIMALQKLPKMRQQQYSLCPRELNGRKYLLSAVVL